MDDFDFLFAGPWTVANTRLSADGTTERFAGRSFVDRIPGGHLERLSLPDVPGAGAVEAFTVRLFEPATALWRIWWSASTRPGHLDPPMQGRFTGGVGTFEGDDVLTGARLRFVWTPGAEGGPRWEQARSRDGGASWRTDWTMELTAA